MINFSFFKGEHVVNIEPIFHKSVSSPNGRYTVVIEAFGKSDKADPNLGWSLATLKGDYRFTPLASLLRQHLGQYGISRVYAPQPTRMNGELCRGELLAQEFNLGDSISVMRGYFADACIFKHDQSVAYIITPSDCPLTVSPSNDGEVLCCHAARDSIISKTITPDTDLDEDTAFYKSNVLRHLCELSFKNTDGWSHWAGLSIAGENFAHPLNHVTMRERNQTLLSVMGYFEHKPKIIDEVMYVDLLVLIEDILKDRLPRDTPLKIDKSVNTFSKEWYSHRRDEKTLPLARNLVTVRCV